jgi:hypothetical protein
MTTPTPGLSAGNTSAINKSYAGPDALVPSAPMGPGRTHYLDEPDPLADPKSDGEQTSDEDGSL